MLNLILIDLQYEQNIVFNFEKGSNDQDQSTAQQNFPLPLLEWSPYP